MKRLELNKLNMQLNALTFGPQTILPIDHSMAKKRMCLICKQYKSSLSENGDMSLQSMTVG